MLASFNAPLFYITLKLEIINYNSYIQFMKRRNFLKGAAALFAFPSLPTNALASVTHGPIITASASVASRSSVDIAYIWCRQFIENRPDFTPNMLTQSLGFSEKIVDEVLSTMVKNKIIQPTLVKGGFKKIDSVIDFIDHNKLKSVLDVNDAERTYAQFLENEEIREEEISDVSMFALTHAGIDANINYA